MAEGANGSKRLPLCVYAIPALLLVLVVVYAIVMSSIPATRSSHGRVFGNDA